MLKVQDQGLLGVMPRPVRPAPAAVVRPEQLRDAPTTAARKTAAPGPAPVRPAAKTRADGDEFPTVDPRDVDSLPDGVYRLRGGGVHVKGEALCLAYREAVRSRRADRIERAVRKSRKRPARTDPSTGQPRRAGLEQTR